MIILAYDTKYLQIKLNGAITTNELIWNVSYMDPIEGDSTDGLTSGATPITICPGATPQGAVPSSWNRRVMNISVYNADTVPQVVTINYNDNGTTRTIVKINLDIQFTLHYEDHRGWYVTDENGAQTIVEISIIGLSIGETVVGSVANKLLYVDGALTLQEVSSLTTNYIPVASSNGMIANSIISQTGAFIGINKVTSTATIHAKSSGATISTFAMKLDNSADNPLFYVYDSGQIKAGDTAKNLFIGTNSGIVVNLVGGATGNTGIGVEALHHITSGIESTAVGYYSQSEVTTGLYNASLGAGSLEILTTGNQNTAIGSHALQFCVTGNNNTAVGNSALNVNTASENTAVGAASLQNNTTGTENAALGWGSLYTNIIGNSQTAIGYRTLFSSTGNNNTAIGDRSQQSTTSGTNNTTLGIYSGGSITTGSRNVFLGAYAGYYETGSDKLFIDNVQRADEADARVKALMYGVFDAATANQYLYVNGNFNLPIQTASRVAIFDASKNLISADTATYPSLTELGYVKGVTSAIQTQINGKEPTIASGTTAKYWRGDKTFQTLDTSVVPENGNLYFTTARTLATALTGLSITGSSISATDTILQAFGKVQNQINGVLGGAIYQGTWNANTNSPALASGVGTKGYYYVISVDGATNLDGITDWKVGDWAIFNGTAWQKVDNTDAVSSVNGAIGAVSLGGTANRITVTGVTWDIAATYVGQASITTLGTITTGTWNGTSISTTYTDAKVKTVTGTANRITIGGTATDPTFDISTTYVGQATITTLGTIATGVWNGTVVSPVYGGTGIANNVASTLTISGSYASTFTITGAFTYTFPTASATLLANNLGIAGGSTLIGGTAASENLTLFSTSHATKGKILFGTSGYDEVNNRLGIGTAAPIVPLDVRGRTSIVNTTGGTSPFNYLDIGGSTANNTNLPGIRLYGGTFATTYASISVADSGLSLTMSAASSATFQFTPAIVLYNSNSVKANNYTDFTMAGTSIMRLLMDGRLGIKVTAPTALLHLAAGIATANFSPLKLTTSGTGVVGLLSVAEKGAMEFSDYGLWFTPGATRHKVWAGLIGAAAPATNNIGVILDYFGTSSTRVLTTPNTWISIIGDDGNTYKVPAYS